MDDTQIFGIAVTAMLLLGGLPWALPSLRRLFLVAVVLGIAGSNRVGTATGGVYPYEILVIVCGLWLLVAPRRRLLAYTQRVTGLLVFLAVWWMAGALFSALVVQPDLSFLVSMGLSVDYLQAKYIGHLIVTILVVGIAFWAGGTLFNPETDTNKVLSAVLSGTALLSLATLFAWATTGGGVLGRYNFDPPTGLGQGGTSNMLLIGAVCCLILLLKHKSEYKALLTALFLLHLSALITIQTRQGYASALLHFAVLVPLCGFVTSGWRKRILSLAASMCVVGIVLVSIAQYLATSALYQSFVSLTDASSQDRSAKTVLFDYGMGLFRQHPLIGVGRGQFAVYVDVPIVISRQAIYVATPHNGLVELLSETGALGAILAYATLLMVIWRLWHVYTGPYSPLTRSLAVATAFMVSYVMVDSFFQGNAMFPAPVERDGVRNAFLYWFLAGFASGARRRSRDGTAQWECPPAASDR